MRVLAIDPGNMQSAYCFWNSKRITGFGKVTNAAMLPIIKSASRTVDVFAVEQIRSYGMAVGASIFDTCVWSGRFEQYWYDCGGIEIMYVPRKDIKIHHCNAPRANDANIRAALIDRLGAPGTKKAPGPTHGISNDCWAALALAVYVTDKHDEATRLQLRKRAS